MAIIETRIKKQVSLLNNLNLNYFLKFTPTEISAGGTLLYIANHLSCKCYNVLNTCKKNELSSTFIEIVILRKSNIFVGVIYRYPLQLLKQTIREKLLLLKNKNQFSYLETLMLTS